MLVGEILIDEPGHGRERPRRNVGIELGHVDDVGGPGGTEANRPDAVEHRPDLRQDVEVRAVKLPIDATRENVRNARDVETGEDIGLRARAVHQGRNRRGVRLVAAPERSGDVAHRRVVGRPVSLRREEEHVPGEARPEHVGEEVIAEGECLGVGPVVRNARFAVLGIREVVSVDGRGVVQVPTIHSAIGPIEQCAGVGVTEIARSRVRGLRRRDGTAVGEQTRRGSQRAGKGAEVVVEGVVLFHDHDDVLDRRARRPRVSAVEPGVRVVGSCLRGGGGVDPGQRPSLRVPRRPAWGSRRGFDCSRRRSRFRARSTRSQGGTSAFARGFSLRDRREQEPRGGETRVSPTRATREGLW